jgi:hypothetical protein
MQDFGFGSDFGAIDVGNSGDRFERGCEFFLGNKGAFEHELAEAHNLSLLLGDNFGKVAGGNVAALAENLA